MKQPLLFCAVVVVMELLGVPSVGDNWSQASGPNYSWKVDKGTAPTKWSVAKNENIVWRTPMPNGGQGGIAIWKDRLFLTTFEEYQQGAPKSSANILGHCLDAKTGKILWSVSLKGTNASPMMYAYSDSTSWTPVTDGKYVWFFNASGIMACYDFKGNAIWQRTFRAPGEPFNKQHEPILLGDTIITLEPLDPKEAGYRADRDFWHYLRGIDKRTGKTKWIAEDGTTYYCTAVLGRLADGTPALLHGRGGPHDVPEAPIGLSLTSLKAGEEGKTIWRWIPEALPGNPVDGTTYQALYTMHWDKNFAYWFRNGRDEAHIVLETATGKLVKSQSLADKVDFRQWNPNTKQYDNHQNVSIRDMKDYAPRVNLQAGQTLHVFPNWHANIVVEGYHYFFTSTGHRRNGHARPGLSGPSHSIGRVNVATGKVEYLEVPVTVIRNSGEPDRFIYNEAQRTKTEDSKGRDVAAEDRSRTDGWQIPAFFGSPIAINGKIYMSTMLGVTYVIDGRAKVFDSSALLAVNDLGTAGETWSLNSYSYSNGKLYTRTLKEVICVGK